MLSPRLSLASLLLLLAGCAGVPAPAEGWQPLAPGLSQRVWAPWPDSEVQALRVDLDRLSVVLSPPAEAGQALDQMASGRGALASVNASFFDKQFRPRGLTISDGQPWPQTLRAPAAAGRQLIVLLAAGRRGEVKGLTLVQTAQLLIELGAVQAFNLDGGGSSTLLIRGESRLPRPLNEPALRRVANALHLWSR